MRIEHDFLGELEVPDNAYYGVQSLRGSHNFNITGQKLDSDFIIALAMVKKAAAMANLKTARLDSKIAKALIAAADEIIDGKLHDNFIVDPIQGGAGTSINMNMNEVLCNRALEIIGEKKGRYDIISPNNHANMAQSTNDAFPTAIKLCIILKSRKLKIALKRLSWELERKAQEFKDVLKMGRTHLQDATPLYFSQELSGYRSMIEHSKDQIVDSLKYVYELACGATAVGTGINCPEGFDEIVTKIISEKTDLPFIPDPNKFHALTSKDAMVYTSGALKGLAANCMKIANDVRWLASGPRSGIHEIDIPSNEPGSSIMPGKVNPTQCEALTMVAVQVMGNDAAIGIGASQGNFELNVFMPLIAYNMDQSIQLLSDAIHSFTIHCLDGLKANKETMDKNLHNSLMLVTCLNPVIGYEKAGHASQYAFKNNLTLKEAILELGYLTSEEFDLYVQPEKMIHK